MLAPEGLTIWTLRAALVALLFTASDPLRMAAAVLVLSVQLPFQRAVLAWDRRERLAPAFVAPVSLGTSGARVGA